MEGFEHLVKVSLEAEDFVVSGPMKFKVKRQTRKKAVKEMQEHGYEIDIVGAKQDYLVLASVKSFFGSQGVKRRGFRELHDAPDDKKYHGAYRLFNDKDLRDEIVQLAATRFSYSVQHIELRLYAGKFYSDNQQAIRELLENTHVG